MTASSDSSPKGHMTAATERRLHEAVGAVADMVSEGVDPTDAAVKIASAFGLLPDQLTLVCTAYNTGAHAALRKSAAGVLDRSGPVPLVDTLGATVRTYGSTKLASVVASGPVRQKFQGAPSPTGPTKPTLNPSARRDGSGSSVVLPTPKAPPAPKDPNVGYKKLAAEALEVRTRAERAYQSLTTKIAELAGYFCRNTFGIGWEDAWSESVVRHGKTASSLFATAQSMYPDVVRAVTARPAYIRYDQAPHSIVTECIKLAAECVDHTDNYIELQAATDAARPPAREDESGVSTVLRKSAAGLMPDKGAPPPPIPKRTGGDPDSGLPKNPNTPVPATPPPTGIGAAYGRAMSEPAGLLASVKPPSPADRDRVYDDTVRALVDPYAMSQQRQSDTQLMLTDLIGSDPVIASHPPSKVLAHYNEMSQLAPRLMETAGAARAMLRQRLESGAGGIDPFQIEQLLKAENEMRKRDDPAYGKGVLDL